MMFLGRANARDTKGMLCFHAAQTGKHLLRTQNVSGQNQKHFCVPDTKLVSATNVAPAGKRGNVCVGNNGSSFTRALSACLFSIIEKVASKFQRADLENFDCSCIAY